MVVVRPAVLVVDDETPLHAIYARVVRGAGGEPTIAATCAEAEALLARHEYACALLDKNLPDGSGLTLARRIGGRSAKTAIVLITGFASLDSVEDAIATGVFDYIVKPFDLALLHETLTAALAWAASDAPTRRPGLRRGPPV